MSMEHRKVGRGCSRRLLAHQTSVSHEPPSSPLLDSLIHFLLLIRTPERDVTRVTLTSSEFSEHDRAQDNCSFGYIFFSN